MKRTLTLILVFALLLPSLALAVTEAQRTQLAEAYLPQNVTFVREKQEDGLTELLYTGASPFEEYTLKLDADGQPVELNYELEDGLGGASRKLTGEDAALLLDKLFPGAGVTAFWAEYDDARAEIRLSFQWNDLPGDLTLNAEDGTVLEYHLYYQASAASAAAGSPESILQAAHPGAIILELETEASHGLTEYEGKAQLEKQIYEFEIKGGTLVKWKVDD